MWHGNSIHSNTQHIHKSNQHATVYFTASVKGKQRYLNHYKEIIQELKSLGMTVISDHIIKTSEDEIKKESDTERIKFEKKVENWITNADCVVVETSFPSTSVGYEISLALMRNKPILILYADSDPPSLLAAHISEHVVCERYSKHTLSTILSDFLRYALSVHDTRFTFFITPQIASYLEEMSKKMKVPKSVYLRQLIEEDMRHG